MYYEFCYGYELCSQILVGLGSEKKWYGTYSDKPDGDRDKTAERMMLNFAESGHLYFAPLAPWKEEN